MSGGARMRSGPPPDPSALRREWDKGTWTSLPAAGREGDPPAWPLTRATARELVLWAEEWQRPQALMWEANRSEREVALYVRALRLAENPRAATNLRTLVRQYMDGLGVSDDGMLRKRWRIEEVAAQASVRTDDTDSSTVRARFQSITGGIARAS